VSETPEFTAESGARSSTGSTRYRYFSKSALHALAEHLHDGTDGTGGAARYGIDNWQKGITDYEFLTNRLEHLQDHAQEMQIWIQIIFNHQDSDLTSEDYIKINKAIRGIGANWMFIQHAVEQYLNNNGKLSTIKK
jgi:hypothetical protein